MFAARLRTVDAAYREADDEAPPVPHDTHGATGHWTPQRWSHADVIDMQARLDPARMTGYADHWRRVLDEACAVFTRLDADVTRHLDESWRGHAGRQALEALRGYISEALDGLARCRSLADALEVLSDAAGELRAAVDGLEHVDDLTEVRVHYSEPAVAAGNAVGEIPAPPSVPGAPASALPALGLPSPASTVPAGFGVGIEPPDTAAVVTGIAPQRFRRFRRYRADAHRGQCTTAARRRGAHALKARCRPQH